MVEIGLVDSQMSWLVNVGSSYLTSGEPPRRDGNAHPNIVPYQVFATRDGHVIVAVGNDGQFARLCDFLGHPGWAEDVRFATNPGRLRHRETLIPMVEAAMAPLAKADVIEGLEARRRAGGAGQHRAPGAGLRAGAGTRHGGRGAERGPRPRAGSAWSATPCACRARRSPTAARRRPSAPTPTRCLGALRPERDPGAAGG